MDLKKIKLLVVTPSIIYRGFIAISTMTSIIHFYILIYGIRLIIPAYRATLTLLIMGIASTGPLNAVFNPLVYCYRDRRFKKAVLELLRIKKTGVIYPVSSHNPQKNAQRSRRAKPREDRSQSLTKSSSCHLSDGRIRKKLVKRSMSSPAFSL